MNSLFVIQFHQKGCLPLLKPYLVCSREEVRKVVFWEGFCCFSCCIDSNWQPGTARTKLQSTKSDIYKPLNIYVFGQQHFIHFFTWIIVMSVCEIRLSGFVVHWSLFTGAVCLMPGDWRASVTIRIKCSIPGGINEALLGMGLVKCQHPAEIY